MFPFSTKLWRLYAIIFLGLTARAADTNAITSIWKLSLDQGASASSPAIALDGTIYEGTFQGRLLAISPEGKVQWNFRTGAEIKSSPAVGTDGTIYFGSRDRKFYALSPAGKQEWIFATGAWVDSSPALGADGTVYFGSWNKNFYALNRQGQLKWKFATGKLITTSPAIASDGTIYFGSHDRFFYALAPDGRLKWKFLTGAEIDGSPAIGADGSVYFSSTDGILYALRPDGTESWRLRTGSYTAASPVLDQDGNLYLAANRDHISVAHDGKLRWLRPTDVPMDAAELVAGNGRVYASIPWLHLGSSDRAGNFDWGFKMINNNLSAAPNISPLGVIYATDGSYLYALSPTNSPVLEKSSWPMWHANPQHTGRVQ